MKNYITLDEHKNKLLADPTVRKEYDHLAPEYELIRTVIDKRMGKKMSQAQLAKKVGTGQSAISRLESGTSNPSFKFLQKVAQALGSKLVISMQ